MSELMIVQRGLGTGYPRVEGTCPACGLTSLFVGEGGYVTCANRPCDDPTAPSKALGVTFPDRTAHPCGHPSRSEGCGGCDPSAIEFVIEDGTRAVRPFDPALDTDPATPTRAGLPADRQETS